MNFSRRFALLLMLVSPLLLAGCSTLSAVSPSGALEGNAKWALLPMVNQTDTPQAALAAEAIAEHALRVRGARSVLHYPAGLSKDSLFEPTERRVVDEAQLWAREQGARYGLTGVVQEWRYKVGIDGEPAVGLTLQVIDIASGQVLWSAAGAKSGWSREALSAVANKLLTQLLAALPLQSGAAKP